MTDDRPDGLDSFERALRHVLADDAPSAAPAAFHERVRHGLSRQAAARSGAPWLAAAAALVVLLGAAALIGPRLVLPPGVTPAPKGTASNPGSTRGPNESPGASASRVIASPAIPFLPDPIEHPGLLVNGELLDREHGWAMSFDNQFLMTSSGGARWRDAAPPGLSSASDIRPYFIDPVHGWLFAYDEAKHDSLLLWRTVDAGTTWERIAVPAVRAVNWQVEFLDPNAGWLGSDPGGQAPDPELRWTSDGGRTWSEPIELQAAAGVEVFPSYLTFLDAGRGFMTDKDRVRRTDDGGRSWRNVAVPVPSGLRGTLTTYGIRFVDQEHGFIRAQERLEDYTEVGSVLYTTDNGGDTWRIAYRFDGEDRRGWSLIDSLRWVASDGNQVWRTADGGATWEVDAVTGFPAAIRRFRLDMLDMEVGLAWVTYGSPCRDFGCPFRVAQLFKTIDEGRTWTRLGDCEPGNELNFVCGSAGATPTPRPS